MHIIKLSATPSTNDYLKQLYTQQVVANFTIVVSSNQTNGKGQMGTYWEAESGKNLTFSILIKDLIVNVKQLFTLNILVSLALVEVLERYKIPNVTVKWPNDIMAEQKKVGGILIENSLKSDGTFTAVVGFGLNLNQTDFELLPQANSLTNITHKVYDVEAMAKDFIKSLKLHLILFPERAEEAWARYDELLFKRGKPAAFESADGTRFMGMIQTVTRDGKLAVLLNDDSVVYYDLKEVKLLY